MQCFPLFRCESVLAFYSSSLERPPHWSTLFPHSTGMKEQVSLPLCTIVTEGGILECRPRYVKIFIVDSGIDEAVLVIAVGKA